jgi:ATP-dependent DNA helicase RecG
MSGQMPWVLSQSQLDTKAGTISAMQASIQKLQKFFKLEAELGYNNRAIIGGFEKMALSWEAEARADDLPEDLIQAILERLRNYTTLSPASRQETLHGLWRRIQRTLGEQSDLDLLAKNTVEEPTRPITADAKLSSEAPTEPIQREPAASPKPPSRQRAVTRSEPAEPPAALDAPVTAMQGVGAKYGENLKRLGIYTLGDLLYYFPRRYLDFSLLKPINKLRYGEEVTVIGTIESIATRPIRNGQMQLVEALLSDSTGVLRLNWFNQVSVARRLRPKTHVSVSGKIEQYLGRLIMRNPAWEPLEQQQIHTNRLVPIYSSTAGITQRWLRNLMNQVINYWAPRLEDPFSGEFLDEAGLMDLSDALVQIHFPDSWNDLNHARIRHTFDEIFYLQMGVLGQKRAWLDRAARIFETPEEWLTTQIERLPYSLTNAQQHALQDIRLDLTSGTPMNRLLQGDVGSGKTVVAGLAMGMVIREGCQVAIMAPTSILAEQHFRNLSDLLVNEDGPLAEGQIRMLIGATQESEKNAIREGLANNWIKVVVGTHALIEEPIQFADLEMVIIDEQHRFGVEQRAALRNKGDNPHLLVMTATPIPRSLALTVYGDLDLTIMDEMPPGRQFTETFVIRPGERERAYTLIRNQVEKGRQAFIIYPLVEESERSEAMAAVESHRQLQEEIFPQVKIGLLHGRLRPEEKEQVMERFRNGDFQILVSTSVVEVGVDVPNATVMLVEGANRFGLAQLHQFRGRVGRGEHRSYCVLIPEQEDDLENQRLAAMASTNDGFKLAEIDLDQRGPGDFLGVRQSGLPELRLASLTDIRTIEKARQHALKFFEADPALELPEHQTLSFWMERFWRKARGGDIS